MRSPSTTAQPVPPAVLNSLLVLAVLNVVLFIAFSTGLLPPLWVATFVVYAFISVIQSRKVGNLFQAGLALLSRLRRLERILTYLEDFAFTNQPQLRALCEPLHSGTTRPALAWL